MRVWYTGTLSFGQFQDAEKKTWFSMVWVLLCRAKASFSTTSSWCCHLEIDLKFAPLINFCKNAYCWWPTDMAINDWVISGDALSSLSSSSHGRSPAWSCCCKAWCSLVPLRAGGAELQESWEVLDHRAPMILRKAVNGCCEAIKSSCVAAGVLIRK